MSRIEQALDLGLQALNGGQLETAQLNFAAVLSTCPEEPNALFLLGAVRQRQGRLQESEQLMRRALPEHPEPADVLNSLGNLMRKMQQPTRAIEFYLQALEKRPHFASSHFNLGLTFKDLGRHAEAVVELRAACGQSIHDAHSWTALGSALQEMGEYDEALEAFDKALEIAPGRVNTLNNKGVTLRILHRLDEALFCYHEALPAGDDVPELHFNIACASYDAGNEVAADEALNRAIKLKPDYVVAHETLNKMYWETGQSDKFNLSFQAALKRLPDCPELWVAYANQLKMANRSEEAFNTLDVALKEIGPVPQIQHCLGMLYGQTGNAEKAVDHISTAVKLDPDNDRYRIDVSNFLIQEAQYDEALRHLDVAQQLNPFEQEMWALKGLCWRFTGDDREAWLNDYDRFVQAKVLDTPDGYDNLEHFIHDLRKTLIGIHTTVKAPLDQSVRYGTQTPGRLLFHQVKEIIDYRTVLEKRIVEYIGSLPDDPSHPFLSRKSAGFRFSGSWSVRLKSGGFHVNHVHPDGWFSGPTYMEVPTSVRADDPDRSGWVTFGETGMNLGPEREVIAKAVCPQEGLCAFFPSYVWHGTIPFHSDEHRMSTPCDVVPLSG